MPVPQLSQPQTQHSCPLLSHIVQDVEPGLAENPVPQVARVPSLFAHVAFWAMVQSGSMIMNKIFFIFIGEIDSRDSQRQWEETKWVRSKSMSR